MFRTWPSVFPEFAFIPHGHCYLWNPGLVWLHILSDSFIAIAYFSIPIALYYFVRKRRDLPYPWLFLLFCAFIVACGLTHLVEIWTLWHPNYWSAGILKSITALVSMATASTLIPVIPKAIQLPSRAELETAKQELEMRVQQRTKELQLSEERLKLALDGSGDSLWDWKIETGDLYLSPRWYRILGYEESEGDPQIEFWKELIHPDDKGKVLKKLKQCTHGKHKYFNCDYRVKTKADDWKWIGSYGQVTSRNPKGKAIRMSGTHKDISIAKKREEELADSLAEKNVMLQEIHHRVKNNLQIICSLLNLQYNECDKDNATFIQESTNRVKSMALVHENLYHSESFSKIDLASYVKNLSNNLLHSYRPKTTPVEINVEVADLNLDIETVVPCGLIINELVSNSLKYAFPEDRKGEIRIEIGKDIEDKIRMTVSDDGIGLPPSFNLEQTMTMGTRMVKALVRQISGNVTINKSLGTTFQIVFPQ